MIVLIDNYDSFTFNLRQYVGELTQAATPIQVIRNDAMTVREVAQLNPSHIIISPGPCTPKEAGISVSLVRALSGTVPILGVCLGHQAIIEAFNGEVVRAERIMHGKTSLIRHDAKGIFANLPKQFRVTRYHSLIARPGSIPAYLEVQAVCADDESEIMAIRHREHLQTVGVQFHPEAILTEHGKKLLANFLDTQEEHEC